MTRRWEVSKKIFKMQRKVSEKSMKRRRKDSKTAVNEQWKAVKRQ